MNPMYVATQVLRSLEAAWNRADGAAYGAAFTDDADFVDIRGELHHGRLAIAKRHQWVFDNIYKNSRVDHKAVDARALSPDVIVAHGVQTMATTNGILDGRHAINTLTLIRDGQTWRIVALHNALADAGTTQPAR